MTFPLLPIYTFCAFAILFSSLMLSLKSAFATSLVTSLFSVSCAILYFFLNSPDVSMTEVAVSVFLSTAFYLMTARITRVEFFEKPHSFRIALSIMLFFTLIFFIYSAIITIGEFGNIKGVMEGSGGMHLTASYKDFHIPNSVTAILASFRGFDTFGETIIILTSALGIFLILEHKNSKYTSL
jgi:multicomponent Na+:H+ antiporter subunit B